MCLSVGSCSSLELPLLGYGLSYKERHGKEIPENVCACSHADECSFMCRRSRVSNMQLAILCTSEEIDDIKLRAVRVALKE